MPIFLVRQAPFRSDAPRLRPPATWRWVETVQADTPTAAIEMVSQRIKAGTGRGLDPRMGLSQLVATSLLSWMVELEGRRKAARAKLRRGEDATVSHLEPDR